MLRAAKDINVSDQINRMQSEISNLTSQLSTYVTREGRNVNGMASKLVDNLNSKVNDYSGQIGDLTDTASEQLDGLQRFLTVEVKRHPLRTLAIAGIAGLIIGAVSRSR